MRQEAEKPEGAEDVDEDSDEDSDDEIDEELGYISPLDNVDPYVTFKQALASMSFSNTKKKKKKIVKLTIYIYLFFFFTAFQVQNPQMYQLATTGLNIDQQTQLMEIMSLAEQNAATPQA